jgi:hypothetical protein
MKDTVVSCRPLVSAILKEPLDSVLLHTNDTGIIHPSDKSVELKLVEITDHFRMVPSACCGMVENGSEYIMSLEFLQG